MGHTPESSKWKNLTKRHKQTTVWWLPEGEGGRYMVTGNVTEWGAHGAVYRPRTLESTLETYVVLLTKVTSVHLKKKINF